MNKREFARYEEIESGKGSGSYTDVAERLEFASEKESIDSIDKLLATRNKFSSTYLVKKYGKEAFNKAMDTGNAVIDSFKEIVEDGKERFEAQIKGRQTEIEFKPSN